MRLRSLDDAKHAPRGEHRAPCPMCDKGTKDTALGVTVDDLGIVWHCFRCEFAGASQHAQICAPPPFANLQKVASLNLDSRPNLAEWAEQIWSECLPLSGVAVAYLKARGCVIPPEGDLRWHPQLKNSAANYTGPALVGLVTDAVTNRPMSLHRTWIKADGTKACTPARMLAAGHRKAGGVIRLWPDDYVTYGLAIAEGVESALSVAHDYTPVWAVIDAGNMAAFPKLRAIETLIIAADNDPVGIKAANTCAERWGNATVAIPPVPGQDWNDRRAA